MVYPREEKAWGYGGEELLVKDGKDRASEASLGEGGNMDVVG